MSFDIDLTSLLAGVSLTAVGGWLVSFLAFRKEERGVQLEQITKERTKWRDNMRNICEEIANAHVENKASASTAKVASLRARLATSINPKDKNDCAILAHYDRLFSGDSDDLGMFFHRIALLLKHDWERVKWECTPLYIKPFKRFSKKQREWRQVGYREVGLTSAQSEYANHISEEKEKSGVERFLLQLIEVKPEEVTLKFAFDNIKNYGIAGTLIVSGFYLAKHGAHFNNFHGAGVVFGSLLAVAGLGLYILNLVQAIWALVKLKVHMVPYLIFSIVMFFATSELVWVLIMRYIQEG